jgi:RNA polymerase sigma-70 factor (ECF subfamily)
MADTITQLQGCLDRLRAGDETARDDLFRCAGARLSRLARKMSKDFPGVARWEQTDDILQNALIRLCRALQDVKPPSVRDFFRLAALQLRRELLDLARHYAGPRGLGASHAGPEGEPNSDGTPHPADEPSDSTYEPNRLALWTEFHRHVENLPDDEREIVDLLWYQGLPQADAAALLNVDIRTVKRRWQAARLRLDEAMNGELPGF